MLRKSDYIIIYFSRQNIHGAWVVYGINGVKQYYGYTKKQAEEKYITEFDICIAQCGIISNYANEIKALLRHKNNNMIKLNKIRLKADIQAIKDSLSEIELTFAED